MVSEIQLTKRINRIQAMAFILLFNTMKFSLLQRSSPSNNRYADMMIDVIRCSESNRRESICERIVPFPVFRACLADLWEPLRNVQDIIIRREYFEAVGRRTIHMPQRYNSIALCCDHIVAFYDGKVASMKPRDIYREHWQEVLQSLPRSHSWTETQYLAAHCFNWHISQWMYEISAFCYRLHSSVDSLLEERNRHPNSVECGRLKVEARFDKHQLTYWLIEITEASLRNSYPNIDGLIQKVVETTLPKVSQIAPVIKEYVDTTLPHIRRLYQLDKYLTVEEVTGQIENDTLGQMIEGTQSTGVTTHVASPVQNFGQ